MTIRAIFLVFIGIFFFYSQCHSSLPPPSQDEIDSLYDLYISTSGDSWSWKYPLDVYGNIWNFSSQVVNPCDDWQGIACVNNTLTLSYIRSLSLPDYNLTGSLPLTLSNLSYLSVIDLEYNFLTGSIPPSTCSLTNLTYVNLGSNQLTGTIYDCLFSNLLLLQFFSLHVNQIYGSIPDSFSSNNLSYLSLSYNLLTGSVPSSISTLGRTLSEIYLEDNLLGGSLDWIQNLPGLSSLTVNTNTFQGSLPNEIYRLSKLLYFYFQENQITGTIPEQFNSTTLIYLTGYANHLTGPFSIGMSHWGHLQVIAIDGNYLSGPLPEFVGNWTNIEQLTIYSNLFTGTLPYSLSQLPFLQMLICQENFFTGNPSKAFNRSMQYSLQTIDLAINHFTGSLSVELFGGNLTSISLYQSCYDTTIPKEICDSTKLNEIALDGLTSYCSTQIWKGVPDSPQVAQSLKGGIPECIWTSLPNLTTFHISGNGLSGTIPCLESYAKLTDIDLSFNSLHGTIPSRLQNWTQLTNFNLQHNKFVGLINHLGDLNYSYHTNQPGVYLTLSTNRLSGIIPKSLEHAQYMDIVDGNLFSCSMKHQPPYSDSESTNYVCGSNLLDISLIILLSCGSFFTLVVILILYVIQTYLIQPSSSIPSESKSSNNSSDTNRSAYSQFQTFISNVYQFIHNENYLKQILLKHEFEMKPNQPSSPSDSYYSIISKYLQENYSKSKIMIISILYWYSVSNKICDPTNLSWKEKTPNLVQFLISLKTIKYLTLILMFVVVIINSFLFMILKVYYGTYYDQYNWNISGAFLSGYEPSVIINIVWAIFLFFSLYYLSLYIPLSLEENNQLLLKENNSRMTSSSSIPSMISNRSQQNSISNLTNISSIPSSPVFNSKSKDSSDRSSKDSKTSDSILTTKSLSLTISSYLSNVRKVSFWISFLALLLNILVVLSMKAGFLYLIISSSTTFNVKIILELCISLLDVVWGSILVPYIITNLPRKKSTGRMLLKASMLYFNSIFAPCLVIMIADDSCFNGLFVRNTAVTQTFTFFYCLTYQAFDSHQCQTYSNWTIERNYIPTFYYNYDCYSTIIIEYLPVFIVSYTCLTLAIPLFSLLLITRKTRWQILDFFPRIFYVEVASSTEENGHGHMGMVHDIEETYPQQSDGREQSFTMNVLNFLKIIKLRGQIMFPAYILASGVHHLIVMLTFGILSPPLAVCIGLVVSVSSITWEILIGRWIVRDEFNSSSDSIDIMSHNGKLLDDLCQHVCCSPRKCFSLLAFGSGIFFALVSLDMSGDAVGWKKAFWLPFVVLAYCFLVLLYFSIQKFTTNPFQTTKNTIHETDLPSDSLEIIETANPINSIVDEQETNRKVSRIELSNVN